MLTTVYVTEDHIKYGKRGYGQYCPVATAIGELLINARLDVSGSTVCICSTVTSSAIVLRLPSNAIEFIRMFDGRKKTNLVEFSFVLDIPQEYLKSQ